MKFTKVQRGWYATEDGTYAVVVDGYTPSANDEDGGAIYGEWAAVYCRNADGRTSPNGGENLDWFPTMREAREYCQWYSNR